MRDFRATFFPTSPLAHLSDCGRHLRSYLLNTGTADSDPAARLACSAVEAAAGLASSNPDRAPLAVTAFELAGGVLVSIVSKPEHGPFRSIWSQEITGDRSALAAAAELRAIDTRHPAEADA